MRTKQQDKFELLVIKRINCVTDIDTRIDMMRNFVDNRENYYDRFCDMIYELSQNQRCLLLDETGLAHIGDEKEKGTNSYLCLLTNEDIHRDCEDIVHYIDLALDRLEKDLLPP